MEERLRKDFELKFLDQNKFVKNLETSVNALRTDAQAIHVDVLKAIESMNDMLLDDDPNVSEISVTIRNSDYNTRNVNLIFKLNINVKHFF